MKRWWLLLPVCGMLAGAELPAVHKVYLLPMTRGLDQYLADLLTQEHVFEVVTDPKVADAIFTDRIGEAFEERLADLMPTPEPVAPRPETNANALPTDTVNKLTSDQARSTFGRGRGVVFLVDPKSHEVLWSAYRPPKSSSSDELHRTASDIVSRLKRALGMK